MPFIVGELAAPVTADTTQFNRAMKDVQRTGANAMTSLSKKMGNIGRGMTMGVTVPIAAVAAGLTSSAKSAIDFEKNMKEVFTLLPNLSKDAMNEMQDQVIAFSNEFGKTTDEVIPALYQAISAGVDKNNVFDFLAVSQKAAIGGITELETSVDGITSVVNAYGEDVISAGQASDLMFTAVKEGKTTFDEMAQSLFQVIPTASALGVEFGDVTAAIASITAQGTPTRVATTQIRQMLVELSKAGGKTAEAFQEISGRTFREFVSEGGNVQQALMMLEKYAQEADVGINDLFGSVEAGNAALGLTGKGQVKFTQSLDAMTSSAGATEEAFQEVDSSTERSLEKLQTNLANLKTEIGKELLPVINDTLLPVIQDDVVPSLGDFAEGVGDVASAFGDLPAEVQKSILALLGLLAVAGPVMMMLSPLVKMLGKVAALGGGAVIGAGALTFGGIWYGLIKDWDNTEKQLETAWEANADHWTGIFEKAAEEQSKIMQEQASKWRDTSNDMDEDFQDGQENVRDELKATERSFDSTMRIIDYKLEQFSIRTGDVFSDAVDRIKGYFGSAGEWFGGLLDEMNKNLEDVYPSGSMADFKRDFETPPDNSGWINFRGDIDPTARHSPSLVDNVAKGVSQIMAQYDKLNSIDMNPVLQTSESSITHRGTLTVRGVNTQGELIGSIDIIMDQLATQISNGDRRLANRARNIPV